MTKRLVEQLREMVASPRVHFHYADDVARIAASASRIEELERALKEINKIKLLSDESEPAHVSWNMAIEQCKAIATNALKEPK